MGYEKIREEDSVDALRYRWLRKEYSKGNETYIAESITSEESLDRYIDEQMKNKK
jgi:hypothetical protein